jgi:hypothetical protein
MADNEGNNQNNRRATGDVHDLVPKVDIGNHNNRILNTELRIQVLYSIWRIYGDERFEIVDNRLLIHSYYRTRRLKLKITLWMGDYFFYYSSFLWKNFFQMILWLAGQ